MRRFIACLCLLLPAFLSAQRKVDYQLQARVDLVKKSFAVQGSLTFEIEADHADSVEIVISRGAGSPSLQLSGATATMDTSINSAGDIAYHFRFSRPLPAGTPLGLTYAYERGSAPTFQYYVDSAFCMAGGYGSAWYPQVISYAKDGTGQYSRGTGTIRVTTASGLMAVMAASTLRTSNAGDERTYEFHYSQPDIFSLYIGKYTRQEFNKGSRAFYTYSLSKAINGDDLCHKSAEVLDFLTTQFGPLTIPNFSIIEFPDYVSELTGIGGASILGGVVMPGNALRKFNYALFGHEIGHQWWGNKVLSSGTKGEAILSEAMAQYGSLQVVSRFDSAHAMDYRKTGYPNYIGDQCGLGYLKNAAAGNDEPLSTLSGANDHIIGDSKGFLVLDLLSSTVGKPAFNKAMQTIGEKYSHTGLTWENFQKEIETTHGSSLQWFFQQWFDRTGVPAWESSWKQQQNKLHLTISQKDSIYQLQLEVLITYTNGTKSLQHINIRNRSNQLQLPVNGPVAAVAIDPYFKVIHWDESLTPKAMAYAKVVRVVNLRMRGKGAEALALGQTYLQEGIPEDQYGVEFTLLYNLGRITAVQNKPDEALSYYQRSLQCATRSPELLAYTYYRIAQIAAAKKDVPLLKWACSNAIKADAINNNIDGMDAKVAALLPAQVALGSH